MSLKYANILPGGGYMSKAQQSIAMLVKNAIAEQKLSTSGAARKWDVHRNFLIELLEGKVPRMLENRAAGTTDPRYAKVAIGIGQNPKEFCAIAAREQGIAETPPLSLQATADGIIIRISRSAAALAPMTMSFHMNGTEVTVSLVKK